jgi:hypothetical protein
MHLCFLACQFELASQQALGMSIKQAGFFDVAKQPFEQQSPACSAVFAYLGQFAI